MVHPFFVNMSHRFEALMRKAEKPWEARENLQLTCVAILIILYHFQLLKKDVVLHCHYHHVTMPTVFQVAALMLKHVEPHVIICDARSISRNRQCQVCFKVPNPALLSRADILFSAGEEGKSMQLGWKSFFQNGWALRPTNLPPLAPKRLCGCCIWAPRYFLHTGGPAFTASLSMLVGVCVWRHDAIPKVCWFKSEQIKYIYTYITHKYIYFHTG